MADHPEFVITLSHGRDSARHVTLALTLGLKSLDEGHSTAILLFLDGVFVGTQGYTDDIDIGEPFLAANELMKRFFAQGGQLLACEICWKFAKLPDGQRIHGCSMATTEQMIDLLLHAKANL